MRIKSGSDITAEGRVVHTAKASTQFGAHLDSQQYVESVISDILSPVEYYDEAKIDIRLRHLQSAIEALQQVDTEQDAALFLSSSVNAQLADLILGVRIQKGSVDTWAAQTLVNWRQLVLNQPLQPVLTGLLIAEAQTTRGKRARKKFESTLRSILIDLCSSANNHLKVVFQKTLRFGYRTRTFEAVINQSGEPLIAVVGVYQTSSGGRQGLILEDLIAQRRLLNESGVELLVVAEGAYFKSAPRIVERLTNHIPHFTNLFGLKTYPIDNLVIDALYEQQKHKDRQNKSRDELKALALAALNEGKPVTSTLLDVTHEQADRVMLHLAAESPELNLTRDSAGHLISQAASDIQFLRSSAADVSIGLEKFLAKFASHLGGRLEPTSAKGPFACFGLYLPDMSLRLPDPIPIVIPANLNTERDSMLDLVDQYLAHGDFVSRIALIVDPVMEDRTRVLSQELAKSQRSQLVVLGQSELVNLMLHHSAAARDQLRTYILKSVDLAYVSPFVSEGPTPNNMFFGRELEIRRIIEQIRIQSFALIGGRKVGKTSILQRLHRTFVEQSVPALYFNCEAHPDRTDFLEHFKDGASQHGIDLLKRAEQTLGAYLERQFNNEFGVLLLDEVDELFGSDSNTERFPHLLSKALRSLAQSRRVAIVATGERTLYSLTADATSPHWNFCTPITVGPLDRDAARKLLTIPTTAMNIKVEEDATELALEQTACHPNLLQFLGTQLVESLARNSTGSD
ncbi:MAG: AAA family ATPase, partial [Proteobacteria bacterium]